MPKPRHIFVYGTLLCDEVVRALTGTVLGSVDATLTGYRRMRVHQPGRDAKGPALTPAPGHHTHGRLLLDVDDRCLRILDLVELSGNNFERVTVEVETAQGGMLQAEVYRATEAFREHLQDDWSLEEFRERHLDHNLVHRIPRLVAQWRSEGLL